MPNEVWAVAAQWGLVGVMVLAILSGIAWAGRRLLSKDGILESQAAAMQSVSKSLDGVALCLKRGEDAADVHMTACKVTGDHVEILHRAAMAALGEIEDEFHGKPGFDITARIERIRQVLKGV